MMKTTFTNIALAALLATGALAGTAFATGNDESHEATALQSAKVTLLQAIATAEQQTGGKAFDAGVDIKGAQIIGAELWRGRRTLRASSPAGCTSL